MVETFSFIHVKGSSSRARRLGQGDQEKLGKILETRKNFSMEMAAKHWNRLHKPEVESLCLEVFKKYGDEVLEDML